MKSNIIPCQRGNRTTHLPKKSIELAQKIKEGLKDRQEEHRSFAKDFQVVQHIVLHKSR